jgi:alpha-tubulin suppressor-like RCC1 family protein
MPNFSGKWNLNGQLAGVKQGSWPEIVKTSLYAWGNNYNGQSGLNDRINRSSPVQVGSLADWSSVSSAGPNITAIKTDGTLWSWGINEDGELGQNDVINRSSPVQVGTLTNWSTTSSHDHTLAVKTDGTLWSWGKGSLGRLGDPTLPVGDAANRSSPIQIGALTTWSKTSAGNQHSLALKTNGTLWAWGNGVIGQIGDNTVIRRSSPVQVGAETNWSEIAAGSATSFGITTDGKLYAWGEASSGKLGLNDAINRSSPVQVGVLTNWSKIASKGTVVHAIKTDGTLWGWGRNDVGGAVGDNTIINRSSPVQIGSDTDWNKVSAGARVSSAIKTDGTLWSWGRNNIGQAGNDSTIALSSPVQIGALTKWTDVEATAEATLALFRIT